MVVDIILSLTRTTRPGYIRDLRRLTVALSRARLGLYILGRRAVFESVYELQPAFAALFARPTQLALVTNEVGKTERGVDDEVESTLMVSVEHLGQYVYEMTKARVQQMKEGVLPLESVREEEVENGAEESDGEGVEDEDVDGEGVSEEDDVVVE